MNQLQAIDNRISRRTYTGPVPHEHAEPLKEMCAALAEEYGIYLQLLPEGAAGVFGGFSKTYGLFKGVDALVLLGVKNDSNESLEAVGYAGEQLVLEATTRGLGTCWVGGTFDRGALQKSVPEGVQLVGVITIGAVENGESGKEKWLRKMMHRKSKTAAEMSVVKGEAPAWFEAGMQAVAKAPSAVHGQPVTVHCDEDRVTATVPGTRSMQYIDLGIAKLHFALAAGGRFGLGADGDFTPEEA